ncbi:hypothetical protein [Klebsiella variicola]|uniref:hypothetical protein n=1 Tax=Klebsiella variicola TaxID=244366 RepID=UPI0015619B0F|nr:hypothetical protein [Klebsiella variicola]NRE95030.1 hypothetical protein [Klebsiella variicola]GKO12924.1 hypothetical protein NUKP99_47450 [Klebsiella variicola]
MNAILKWMSSATKLSAITVSDQVGADVICELDAKDGHIAGSDDIFFHINHLDKEFALVQGISNYTLICTHTN